MRNAKSSTQTFFTEDLSTIDGIFFKHISSQYLKLKPEPGATNGFLVVIDAGHQAHADAFIRIHADGAESGNPSGTMTICQTSKNPYNSNIHSECKELSQFVVDAICARTGSNNRGVWETDTMSGINWCEVPVTIVEIGYMTNKEEDYAM